MILISVCNDFCTLVKIIKKAFEIKRFFYWGYTLH